MMKRAHHLRAPPLHHLNDFTFSFLVAWGAGGDGHPHEIAMEGFPHVRLTDKEFFVSGRRSRLDEAVALGVAAEDPGSVPSVPLRGVLPARLLDEVLGRHFGEDVTEPEVGVVVFNVEPLRNLVGPVGVVWMFSKKCEDVLL
jgi:hypothetical protein